MIKTVEALPVVALPVVAEIEPEPELGRDALRRVARASRREAQLDARSQRAAARQVQANARSAARAVDAGGLIRDEPEVDLPPVHEEQAEEVALDESTSAADSPARGARSDAKAQARQAKAAAKAAKGDHIVEAPRAPRMSLRQRLRASSGDGSGGGSVSASDAASGSATPGGSKPSGSRRRRAISMLAGIIGAIGLICSLLLAFGALLVAIDSTSGSVYDTVSGLCDTLVGPLRDVFSFSGAKADMKESLVAWGAGAIVYLLVGIVAQSLLRSIADD